MEIGSPVGVRNVSAVADDAVIGDAFDDGPDNRFQMAFVQRRPVAIEHAELLARRSTLPEAA